MKLSIKGALLTGLVLPGLGQIVLKRYTKGVAIMVTVLACVAVILWISVQKALYILETLISEGGEISFGAISAAAAQASSASESFVLNSAFLLAVACWAIGTIDAYRTGKKLDDKSDSQ